MAKLTKKTSKRQPARQRYKIQKKIREHNRKTRREAKKNPKRTRPQTIQIPNICPFKEDILKEVEAMKKQKEEEKLKQRELAKLEATAKPKAPKSLQILINNAELRGQLHSTFTPPEPENKSNKSSENSLKAYYKEFRKVIEAADVILEVVDARDPIGTRCVQVADAVKNTKGNKRLVLVLNKADLVPRPILDQWLKYLKRSAPTIAFKASTQDQNKKLAQRKLAKAENATQGSAAVGAEMLMSLLANYCRNKGIKTSIRVGVVGLPNVGKSSIVNSLKRSRACSVGATPGVTKAMQEVQLDSKIKLLDSPGIVFAAGGDSSAALRNAVRVATLADPVTPANAILQRVTKLQMMEMYDVGEYATPDEFYSLKAARMGRFKRGGVPDAVAAARSLLEDWNAGKIKYYTLPPEEVSTEISSAIVQEVAREFDVEGFEAMEVEALDQIERVGGKSDGKGFVLESLGMVDSVEEMEEDVSDNLLSKKISFEPTKKPLKRGKKESKKTNPELDLPENQKLNQVRKKQFKKERKDKNRREKVELQLSTDLENANLLATDENYDFNEDFKM